MNKELVKLANHLDSLGHRDLADRIDAILQKEAGWMDHLKGEYERLKDGAGNLAAGAEEALMQRVEQAKQYALQGSDEALAALEALSEEPMAMAAGVSKAVTDAIDAASSGYASGSQTERTHQQSETAARRQQAAGHSQAAGAAGEASERAVDRASAGAGAMGQAVRNTPGAARHDLARAGDALNITAPGDLTPESAQARTSGGDWSMVQTKLNQMGHTDSNDNVLRVDGIFGGKTSAAYEKAGVGDIPNNPDAALAALSGASAGATASADADDFLSSEARQSRERMTKAASLLGREFTTWNNGLVRR